MPGNEGIWLCLLPATAWCRCPLAYTRALPLLGCSTGEDQEFSALCVSMHTASTFCSVWGVMLFAPLAFVQLPAAPCAGS